VPEPARDEAPQVVPEPAHDEQAVAEPAHDDVLEPAHDEQAVPEPAHDEVPERDAGEERSSRSDAEMPQGVRIFDVSDPAVPVEIERPAPEPPRDGKRSEYVGHHRQGRHRPRLRPKRADSDGDSNDPGRRDRSA
jgi:hypothetical protein